MSEKNMTFIEYFENVLHSQPKVDNVNMSQREIVILVEHGQTVDYIRYELWRLCQKLESKLGLEFDFNKNTKIFGIIKRYDEKIWMTRVYIRRVDKNKLDKLNELRPDEIVVFGKFLAEQVEVLMKFIQHSNKTGLEVAFLNR